MPIRWRVLVHSRRCLRTLRPQLPTSNGWSTKRRAQSSKLNPILSFDEWSSTTLFYICRAVYVSTKSTWKNLLLLLVLETKPAVFAWKSSGRNRLQLNSVSDCSQTVHTVSGISYRQCCIFCYVNLFIFLQVWTAYANGDKRNSLKIKSFDRARNAESSLISFAPVVIGVKRKKRRKSWLPITREPWGCI